MGRRRQNEKYEEKNCERRKNRVELQIGQKKKRRRIGMPSIFSKLSDYNIAC